MIEKILILWMILLIPMLMEKQDISVMNRNKFVRIESRSNDRTKWLIELIDRSL